jgi:hypothetical protein
MEYLSWIIHKFRYENTRENTMKPFKPQQIGTKQALPIRASQFIQLAVQTDIANQNLIHMLLPAAYGQEPYVCRYFDRVEDRRFFLEGETLVTTFTKKESLAIRGEVSPIEDGVATRLAITNLSDVVFPEMQAIVSVQVAAAPSFADSELERYFYVSGGKVVYFKRPYDDAGTGQTRLFSTTGHRVGPKELFPHNPEPDFTFIGLQSRDGKWVVGHGWKTGQEIFGNCHPALSAISASPVMPSIAPGETAEVSGVLYIMQGTPEDCVARFKTEFQKTGD